MLNYEKPVAEMIDIVPAENVMLTLSDSTEDWADLEDED